MPIPRTIRRAWLYARYAMAEFSYVAYRGPHGWRLNQIAAERHERWLAA